MPEDAREPKEERIQSYFCVDDKEKLAFARLKKDAVVLSKERKVITVRGKKIEGWIVKIKTPATDGRVQLDYHEGAVGMGAGEE